MGKYAIILRMRKQSVAGLLFCLKASKGDIIGIIMYYAQVWLKSEAVLIELTPRICYSILDVWNGRDV